MSFRRGKVDTKAGEKKHKREGKEIELPGQIGMGVVGSTETAAFLVSSGVSVTT